MEKVLSYFNFTHLGIAMSNIGFVRMQKECKEVITNSELKENGIAIEPQNETLDLILGYIRGPPDSPYENGTYTLNVKIPIDYPFKPPKVNFVTKIWHPNISSQTGMVCLDILKEQWAASMTLRTVLLSIQLLLASPEPKDPQDAVVARQCDSKSELFKLTAKYWCQHYANGPGVRNEDFLKKHEKLKEMGVTSDEALSALSCNDWNLSKATESIFD